MASLKALEELAQRAAAALNVAAEAPNRSLKRGAARAALLLRKTVRYWHRCEAPKLAAALAFYTMFSLSPMFVIFIAVTGLALGNNAAADTFAPVRSVLGPTATLALQALVASANSKAANVTALITGVITALIGATGLFGQLRDSLDVIWGEPEHPDRGILNFLRENAVAIAMVLFTGLLLMASLVIEAATTVLASNNAMVVRWIDVSITFAAASVLFTFVYKYLNTVHLHWSEAVVGAVVTSLLFVSGQALIGWYLGRAAIGSGYGVAGSLMLVLLWVYYSSLTMLVGAAFTRAYSETVRRTTV
ncbi:MAG: YihY/virulence factor BrkB family protein [Candidatus Eremiobacteraeota bacterium]|nr:YihY/virulence factor BrkB family protein [Candidatus Eremiobacteraeota bacterium]